jgi:hypothetical protein
VSALDATAFAKELATRMSSRWNPRGTLVHVSAPLRAVKNETTGLVEYRVMRPGRTYRNPLRAAVYDATKLTGRQQRIWWQRFQRDLSPRQSRKACKALKRYLKTGMA